jgi:hypothetical protein
MSDRQRLIQEFEELAKQKLVIVESLPEKWASQYRSIPLPADQHASMVAPAAAQPRPPNKRPQSATAGMVHGAMSELDLKKDLIFKECSGIVSKILRLGERAKWFKEPVDVVKYNIPNYHIFVPVPMDLGTVRQRLQSRFYLSPLDFKADMDLIWKNCFAYNQPATEVNVAGQCCQDLWQKSWRESNIEELWSQLQLEVDPKASAAHAQCLHSSLRNQRDKLKEGMNPAPMTADGLLALTFMPLALPRIA